MRLSKTSGLDPIQLRFSQNSNYQVDLMKAVFATHMSSAAIAVVKPTQKHVNVHSDRVIHRRSSCYFCQRLLVMIQFNSDFSKLVGFGSVRWKLYWSMHVFSYHCCCPKSAAFKRSHHGQLAGDNGCHIASNYGILLGASTSPMFHARLTKQRTCNPHVTNAHERKLPYDTR